MLCCGRRLSGSASSIDRCGDLLPVRDEASGLILGFYIGEDGLFRAQSVFFIMIKCVV